MIFDISVLGLGDEVLNAFFDVGGAVDEFEVVLEQTFADDGADNEAEVVGPLLLLFGGVLEVVELGLDAVALPEEAALLGVETVQLGLGTLDGELVVAAGRVRPGGASLSRGELGAGGSR
jgi:hypothetical protein